jgi:hypothetical protein
MEESMVDVKFDLENGVEESVARAAVQKTVRFYQRALAGVTCPTHGSGPALIVKGTSLERLMVSIEGCCEALSSTADARVRAVSRREDDL